MKLVSPYKCTYNGLKVEKGDVVDVRPYDKAALTEAGWTEASSPKPEPKKAKKEHSE